MTKSRYLFAIILASLLIGVLVISFDFGPVEAGGTIYIGTDGTVYPPSANVTRVDDITYIFIGNVNCPIIADRDNIVIDGDGNTLNGAGSSIRASGILVQYRRNITIKNVKVEGFSYGIELVNSSENIIYRNTFAGNSVGVDFHVSSKNLFFQNNFINNTQPVMLANAPSINAWDNGCEGNYWSNYNGTDCDGDGIGDTYLPWEEVDNYPLMNPYRAGDPNHDGVIDSTDLGKVGFAWGSKKGESNFDPHVDFNLDDQVDLVDLNILGSELRFVPGWLNGYNHRKQLSVVGSRAEPQSNYNIKVIVHYGYGIDNGCNMYLGMRASKNFQDIRFTQEDGVTLLACNREDYHPGKEATFSILIPSLDASPLGTTIYIYHDNPEVSWRKFDGNPVFSNALANMKFDSDSIRDMSIVWNGSHYCGFYMGSNGSTGAIGFAISIDGVKWTRMNNGDPVLEKNELSPWENFAVGIPDVIWDDEQKIFHMWYGGCTSDWQHWKVGYANSTNGINWKRSLNNPVLDLGSSGKFDMNQIFNHGTIKDTNGNYTMVYTGRGVVGGVAGQRVGVATSEYPWKNWHKLNNGTHVIGIDEAWERSEVTSGDLVKLDGTYYVALACGWGSARIQIGLAKSTNLIEWIKDACNPILENWDGDFDSMQLHDPDFIQMQDGRWRIYYAGATHNDQGDFKIGFAETANRNNPLFLSDTDGYCIRNGDNTYQIFVDFDKSKGNNGSDEGFDVQSGTWNVEWDGPWVDFAKANFYYQGKGSESTEISIYSSSNSKQSNFVINLKAKLDYLPSSGIHGYEILFRLQDSRNYYSIQYFARNNTGQDEKLLLKLRYDDTDYYLASTDITPDTRWHTIEIFVNNTNCKVLFDGTQKIPSSGWQNIGDNFSSGKIGFKVWYSKRHKSSFDELKVRKYIHPEPSVNAFAIQKEGMRTTHVNCSVSREDQQSDTNPPEMKDVLVGKVSYSRKPIAVLHSFPLFWLLVLVEVFSKIFSRSQLRIYISCLSDENSL